MPLYHCDVVLFGVLLLEAGSFSRGVCLDAVGGFADPVHKCLNHGSRPVKRGISHGTNAAGLVVTDCL